MATTAKKAVREGLNWPIPNTTAEEITQSDPGRYLDSSQISYSKPIEAVPSGPTNNSLQNTIGSQRIDDSLVVDFSFVHFGVGKKIRMFFRHLMPLVVQTVCIPFFYIVFHSVFNFKIKGKEHLKDIKGPVLFISNHISFYESFIFDLFVNPFSANRMQPFRFMGSTRFNASYLKVLKYLGIIDLIYFLFGVFRVTPGQGAAKSLTKAFEIIHEGGTVVMYPEGNIWTGKIKNSDGKWVASDEVIGPFKWGAAILAKHTDVTIVPVAFKPSKAGGSRTKLVASIGEPFKVDQAESPASSTDMMRERVMSLYVAG